MTPLADTASNLTSILFWSFTCIILLVIMMLLIAWLRRRLSPNEDFHGQGFTLADLRRMHKAGQMTDEEFERAKAKLIQGLGDVPQETEQSSESQAASSKKAPKAQDRG